MRFRNAFSVDSPLTPLSLRLLSGALAGVCVLFLQVWVSQTLSPVSPRVTHRQALPLTRKDRSALFVDYCEPLVKLYLCNKHWRGSPG